MFRIYTLLFAYFIQYPLAQNLSHFQLELFNKNRRYKTLKIAVQCLFY